MSGHEVATVLPTLTGEGATVWLYGAIAINTFDDVDEAFAVRDLINGAARDWGIIHRSTAHDWTHPAVHCDEPGCDHITRRTCEGAEKVTKFLLGSLRKRTEMLRKADPAYARLCDERILAALLPSADAPTAASDEEGARP